MESLLLTSKEIKKLYDSYTQNMTEKEKNEEFAKYLYNRWEDALKNENHAPLTELREFDEGETLSWLGHSFSCENIRVYVFRSGYFGPEEASIYITEAPEPLYKGSIDEIKSKVFKRGKFITCYGGGFKNDGRAKGDFVYRRIKELREQGIAQNNAYAQAEWELIQYILDRK